MEPTGADTQLILAALAEGFTGLNRRADDAHGRLVDGIEQRLDAHDLRFDDLHGLIVTVKEAAELQSARIDAHDRRFDELHMLVMTVKEAAELQSTRIDVLTNRVDSWIAAHRTCRQLERRMERGFARVDERFARVDERFEALTREMRAGFAVDALRCFAEMRRGFEEIGRTRRRGPKRED